MRAKAIIATHSAMKPTSAALRIRSMTLEQWYSLLQVLSVVTTALAFLSGAAVILVGLEVNRRNDLKVAQANERAATANERAGKLEFEAAQMRDRATQTET